MEQRPGIRKYDGKEPKVGKGCYIAPEAVLVGDVQLGSYVSVWPACVLRGDINAITVGERSNIQDGTVIHVSDDFPARVGSYVTVGHCAVIHACTLEDECLIGMNATVLDGAVIGYQSLVGANALVPEGMVVPPGSLVLGIPARVVRRLTEAERKSLRESAEKYVEVAAGHARERSLEIGGKLIDEGTGAMDDLTGLRG